MQSNFNNNNNNNSNGWYHKGGVKVEMEDSVTTITSSLPSSCPSTALHQLGIGFSQQLNLLQQKLLLRENLIDQRLGLLIRGGASKATLHRRQAVLLANQVRHVKEQIALKDLQVVQQQLIIRR